MNLYSIDEDGPFETANWKEPIEFYQVIIDSNLRRGQRRQDNLFKLVWAHGPNILENQELPSYLVVCRQTYQFAGYNSYNQLYILVLLAQLLEKRKEFELHVPLCPCTLNPSRGITTFHEQGELRVLISNLLKALKNSFRLTIDLPTPRRSVLVDEEEVCL